MPSSSSLCSSRAAFLLTMSNNSSRGPDETNKAVALANEGADAAGVEALDGVVAKLAEENPAPPPSLTDAAHDTMDDDDIMAATAPISPSGADLVSNESFQAVASPDSSKQSSVPKSPADESVDDVPIALPTELMTNVSLDSLNIQRVPTDEHVDELDHFNVTPPLKQDPPGRFDVVQSPPLERDIDEQHQESPLQAGMVHSPDTSLALMNNESVVVAAPSPSLSGSPVMVNTSSPSRLDAAVAAAARLPGSSPHASQKTVLDGAATTAASPAAALESALSSPSSEPNALPMSPFVNYGLQNWESARVTWLQHQTHTSSSSSSMTAIPLDVDGIIDVIFAPPSENGPRKFDMAVPLPQMVDILQDLWEAEGLET